MTRGSDFNFIDISSTRFVPMRENTFPHSSWLFAALFGIVSGSPAALAQHGDVWLRYDAPNAMLRVGVVDEAGMTFTPGVRVFEAILTPDALPFSPFDFSATDPGFLSAAGDLPPNRQLNLLPITLEKWNGVGLDPVFTAVFDYDLSSGFTTAPDGSLHAHPLFGITDNDLDPAPLADGVYVETILPGGIPGQAERFYLVMLKDALLENETDVEALEALLEDYEAGGPEPEFKGKNFAFFEQAVEFVENSVPEPNGLAMIACAVAACAMSRRVR
jgi:hypothetical protein